LFWVRSGGFPFWSSLLFIVVFAIFYTRPAIGNSRFITSALTLSIAPFFIPVASDPIEVIFAGGWGIVIFLLLATKNLILLQRKNIYRIAHFTIVASLSIILIEHLTFMSQVVLFVTLLFLFREFYLKFSENKSEHKTLVAAVESFILIEIAWILSFLSLDVLVGAALLTLFAFIFHDTTLHKLNDELKKQILVRNGAIFAILAIAIVAFSAQSTFF